MKRRTVEMRYKIGAFLQGENIGSTSREPVLQAKLNYLKIESKELIPDEKVKREFSKQTSPDQ